MLSLEDVGYGSELSWTYTYRHSTAVSAFENEYSLIGMRLIALLNAAKRLHMHARPATIQKAAMCVRVMSRAIAKFAPDSALPAAWHKALVSELAEDDRAERSRWSICNHANAILREVARSDGAFPRLVNPFDRTSAPIPILDKDALNELRRCAREDAEEYRRAFLEPAVSPYREIIEEARLMAARNGGTFQRTGNRAFWAFMARVKRATAPIARPWGSREVASRLYATSEAIMPFFILLVDKLAANVDAIAEMKRDCMTEFENPITGKRFLIDVPKPRSGDNVPPYSVADYGPFSVPGIIRFVLAYTEPLVPLAAPADRDFLFLVDTRSRNIRPLSAIPASVAFKTYKQARGICGAMTLNMIRPTRLVGEYERTLDPFRVQRMARQSRLSSLAPYLNHAPAESADERTIAGAQQAIVEQRFRARAPAATSPLAAASLPSHLCLNPRDTAHGLDEHGLCANFLWPLNDRHFVMEFEPRNVAFLLREYEALCEAEMQMPRARYLALYAQRKQLIEGRYLPRVPLNVLTAARAILPRLPPAPRVD